MPLESILRRGVQKTTRVLRRWQAKLFPPLPQVELFPSDVIVHFSHHKNLTAYYGGIMERLGEEFNFPVQHFQANLSWFEDAVHGNRRKAVFSLNNTSAIDFSRFPAYKGSHFIRDPRDLMVSGYRYHLWTREAWCVAIEAPGQVDWNLITAHPDFIRYIESDPARFPRRISYQDYLKSLPFEQGMLLELIWRQFTFLEMSRWQTNPNILECKYEEIIGSEGDVFRKIFEHYQFHPKLLRRGIQIADELSLKNRAKGEKSHIRKGTSGQWKTEFTPLIKEVFKNLHGDLLIQLGYEQDSNW